MMRAELPILAALAILAAADGASAQSYTIPAPSRSEQQTQLLSQPVQSHQKLLEDTMQELGAHTMRMLDEPVGADTDTSLSRQLMAFEHIKIDLAEGVLAYAIDPELRRLAMNDIQLAAQRIAEFRTWQVNREILRRQLDTPVR